MNNLFSDSSIIVWNFILFGNTLIRWDVLITKIISCLIHHNMKIPMSQFIFGILLLKDNLGFSKTIGFSFDLCRRNEMLVKKGLIFGFFFQVFGYPIFIVVWFWMIEESSWSLYITWMPGCDRLFELGMNNKALSIVSCFNAKKKVDTRV